MINPLLRSEVKSYWISVLSNFAGISGFYLFWEHYLSLFQCHCVILCEKRRTKTFLYWSHAFVDWWQGELVRGLHILSFWMLKYVLTLDTCLHLCLLTVGLSLEVKSWQHKFQWFMGGHDFTEEQESVVGICRPTNLYWIEINTVLNF